MFNRWVVNRLIERLDRLGLPYYHVSPELKDISLNERSIRANKIYSENKNTYLLSIHANGGGGEGIEGFTSPGLTKSDKIAQVFLSDLENNFPEQKMRFDTSDGDLDKEAKFSILVRSNCPAFLLECAFMDNKKDYERLWSEQYIERMVSSLYKSIKKLYYV